jgi:hypothetical protein
VITRINQTDNESLDYWLLLAVWTVPLLTVPFGMAGIPASCLQSRLSAADYGGAWRTTSDMPATGGNTGRAIEQVPLAIG